MELLGSSLDSSSNAVFDWKVFDARKRVGMPYLGVNRLAILEK